MQEVADYWIELKDDIFTQTLFKAFGEEETVIEAVKKASSKEANTKMSTPTKTAQKAKPSLDEISPEKVSTLPRRVHGCKPVEFGRPQRKSTLLAKAGVPVPTDEDDPVASAEADQEGIAMGNEPLVPPITRKQHQRTCKKKVLSESEMKMATLKTYLSSMGCNWPKFQAMHYRPGSGVDWGQVSNFFRYVSFCLGS